MGLVLADFQLRCQSGHGWSVPGTDVRIIPRGNDTLPLDAPEREHVPGDAVGETVHDKIEYGVGRLGAAFDRKRSKQQDFFAWGYSHLLDEGLARDPVIVFF